MAESLVLRIGEVNLVINESEPPQLQIHVEGDVSTPGWSDFDLAHRIPIVPPADGIYEADVYGRRPGGAEPDVVTAFEFDDVWTPFPADLKGLRVYSATNSVTTALS
jgi:hypothetical protein